MFIVHKDNLLPPFLTYSVYARCAFLRHLNNDEHGHEKLILNSLCSGGETRNKTHGLGHFCETKDSEHGNHRSYAYFLVKSIYERDITRRENNNMELAENAEKSFKKFIIEEEFTINELDSWAKSIVDHYGDIDRLSTLGACGVKERSDIKSRVLKTFINAFEFPERKHLHLPFEIAIEMNIEE